MPISYDQNMLREIIMDHYNNPRNKVEKNDPSFITIHMDHTDSCTDDIYVQIKVVNNIITECFWHGQACAISTASTSIMSEMIVNKTVEQAKEIMNEFNKMINHEEYNEEILDEAVCFMNTYRQPSRITCATIGWRGLSEAFDELKEHKCKHE